MLILLIRPDVRKWSLTGSPEYDDDDSVPSDATETAADNLLVLGGWNSKEPYLMRSDGMFCNHTIPKFPGKVRTLVSI
jgi:hypothetical protein